MKEYSVPGSGQTGSIILETAVEREKAVEDIYVHREFKKLVVTLWVMRHFLFGKVRHELGWTFVIHLRFLGL
jgi:hypothetical protein